MIDSSGTISIYHPLIIDQGKTAAVAPVVPTLGAGAKVALFFGFNGNTLTLVDTNGQDTNASPTLAAMKCVNGLPGAAGDVFGQVSWCNTDAFWQAANAAVANGQTSVPALGIDTNGNQCLSSRSFEIIDQDQSDNLPTKYLLLPDGSTIQFTAANQKQFPDATEIDNASDEALIADFVDPVIGCVPFKVASLDDPGSLVSSLATQELQALLYQQEPIALVPLNDPDTLLTSNGDMSSGKTNAYRTGVNMPLLGTGPKTDNGSGTDYCNNMIAVQPPFLAGFQQQLTAAATPDAGMGNNLFTFLCNRFLQSITNLNCPNKNIPVVCQFDANGAATACTITALSSTGNGTTVSVSAAGTGTAVKSAGLSTASDLAPSSAFSFIATSSHHRGDGSAFSNPITTTASSHNVAPTVTTTNSNGHILAPTLTTNSSSRTLPTSFPSSSGFTSIPVHIGGNASSTTFAATNTTTAALSLGTGPSATMPPPISQFSAVPTSAVAAICTSTVDVRNCWSAAGWQLCRLGSVPTSGFGGWF